VRLDKRTGQLRDCPQGTKLFGHLGMATQTALQVGLAPLLALFCQLAEQIRQQLIMNFLGLG
jgi:hypothetical protein